MKDKEIVEFDKFYIKKEADVYVVIAEDGVYLKIFNKLKDAKEYINKK
jgi:hypothetical protein